MRGAALAIQSFTAGLDTDAYAGSDLVQAGVWRKFEIIGEPSTQLRKLDALLAVRIAELPQILAFCDQLIHSYFAAKARTF